MEFLKYHGTGNDFIIPQGQVEEAGLPDIARRLCHRQFGFGADGLLMAFPSDTADIRMAYYNQDGSVAPMCGNGLRCFARYVHEKDIIRKDQFRVETLAGILAVDVSGGYDRIRIQIGSPRFRLDAPDVNQPTAGGQALDLQVNGRTYALWPLMLGTFHGVIFTGDPVPEEDARALCHHRMFPGRINVNFVSVKDRGHLEVLTYERGVGYTLACGTGVCAAQVMAHQLDRTESSARVTVPGGTLEVEILDQVYLTGPAVIIGKGEMYDE